jgi:hypothetical protein
MPVTALDLTFKAANKFEKRGFAEGANILRKLAQEAPPAALEEPVVEPPAAERPVAESVGVAEGQAAPDAAPEEPDPEPVDIKDIEPIPGPTKGEYEKLAGNITLADASEKLEEVAGTLADRRVIRLLAEFDIMLDKLGVASMFPELAESQAKLIDAYGYALTRVSKMLGMVSSSNKLVEMAGEGEPTAGQTAEEAPGPAAPEPGPEPAPV